jgi:hypothetical protein
MNQGNIMYVGLTSMMFNMSSANYESVEDFNNKMHGMAKGLYKLGDYKEMRDRDIKYLHSLTVTELGNIYTAIKESCVGS